MNLSIGFRERANYSERLFQMLKLQLQKDVEEINAVRQEDVFRFTEEDSTTLTVCRGPDPLAAPSVRFTLDGAEKTIRIDSYLDLEPANMKTSICCIRWNNETGDCEFNFDSNREVWHPACEVWRVCVTALEELFLLGD